MTTTERSGLRHRQLRGLTIAALLVAACVASAVACSGTPSSPGGDGQPCYANGTCNAGLVCSGASCVPAVDASNDATSDSLGPSDDGPSDSAQSSDGGADAPSDGSGGDSPQCGVDAGAGMAPLVALPGAFAVAVDCENSYWASWSGTVLKCAVGGCGGQPTVLATGQSSAWSIAVDSTSVYWGTGQALLKCAVNGCGGSPTTLASSGGGTVRQVALDTTSVYWLNYFGGTSTTAITKCPLAGCGGTPTVLATVQGQAFDLAVDGTDVYWSTNAGIMKCPIAGCGGSPSVVVSASNVWGIAVDASYLYWAVYANPSTGAVYKCNKAACTPNALATATDAYEVAVDGTNVYWTGPSAGTVSKCAIAGCGGAPIVFPASSTQVPGPRGIAVDGMSIYWAEQSAGVGVRLTPK